MRHVRKVFELLHAHHLFLKQSKCSFGEQRVAYLGHIITSRRISADEQKIQAVRDWPEPKSTKSLHGFLGIVGYYCKFIKDYGLMAAPLTSLLKKNFLQLECRGSGINSTIKGDPISSSDPAAT